MLLKESEWFSVDTGQVGAYLKHMFENYKDYKEKAKRQGYQSRTNFSFDKMKEKLSNIISEKIPEFPKHVNLNLPKLNKLTTNKPTKLPELKLPKLKNLEKSNQKFPNLKPA